MLLLPLVGIAAAIFILWLLTIVWKEYRNHRAELQSQRQAAALNPPSCFRFSPEELRKLDATAAGRCIAPDCTELQCDDYLGGGKFLYCYSHQHEKNEAFRLWKESWPRGDQSNQNAAYFQGRYWAGWQGQCPWNQIFERPGGP